MREQLGLRHDTRLLDLVGQGCGAALPNLQTAATLIAARQARYVLSVCVEVCSAAFYLDDDPGVLISACLFGDGAAAAVLGMDAPPEGPRLRWVDSVSFCSPSHRDALRFEQRGGMLRNLLSPQVPEVAADFAHRVLQQALEKTGLKRAQIRRWILHAGGRDVLEALRTRLRLADADVQASRETLRGFGNLSSPFVLFVLERTLRESPAPGYWWLASFGAGFSSHGAILEMC